MLTPRQGHWERVPIKCALLVTAGPRVRKHQMWAVPMFWSLRLLPQAPPLGF